MGMELLFEILEISLQEGDVFYMAPIKSSKPNVIPDNFWYLRNYMFNMLPYWVLNMTSSANKVLFNINWKKA